MPGGMQAEGGRQEIMREGFDLLAVVLQKGGWKRTNHVASCNDRRRKGIVLHRHEHTARATQSGKLQIHEAVELSFSGDHDVAEAAIFIDVRVM